ncbi:hypothetical protein NNJEOMEG_01723 [Fundidesulfovibrio magnetotacticus]|uniref:PAS domain-containing protein n=2 Tax=Fundidesulfovibrio magnetotacticus TaxID=2730080 RepID=A0A6V8M083_9BACT|nr:hypothetical protein NNJEOMEG_01723 [Fundidesulfovibrio magnetotacticus]
MAREVSIEKELHHQVCLYKSIFNSISSPMLLVEVGGELVLDANAAFAHLSGCQTHEAIGRSCSEIGIALTGPLPLASSPSAAKPAPVTTLQATLGGRRFTVQCQSIACHKDEQRGYATLLFSDSMK